MSMCNLHFFKDISFNVWRKARSPPIWAISVHGAQKPLYYVLTFYENYLEITFFFLEVLILPSINIFKHFHSKKHQCAQFILVCWFHLCKKTSFIILYLTQYLKFACKDSWITSSTIFQYFCLKFLFFHCPIIKTFEINVKKKVPRFLQKYVSTRVYNGKNPSIQNVSEHPEQFNIKIQVPLSCVHTY